MKKTLFVCALLVVSSFSLFAQHRGSNALGQSVSKTVTAPASVKHTLKGTYLNNATIGLSTAGFTNIDTQTVVCPGTAGTCALEVDQAVQIGGSGYGRAALCLLVDGVYTDPCFFVGEALADGNYQTFSQQHQATMSFGSHTVTSQTYTDGTALLSEYNIAYRVYKP